MPTEIFVGGVADTIGAGASVSISAFGGGISNSGTILAEAAGIVVGGFASGDSSVTISTFGGGITNSGTITAVTRTGIAVGGTGLAGYH